MSKKNKIAIVISAVGIACMTIVHIMNKKAEKTTYRASYIEPIPARKKGFYEKTMKRLFDIICGIAAVIVFSPLYIILAIFVRIKLGSPVLFTQDRPGIIGADGRESIFKMYKFRSMTDARDENGELLPDEMRLTPFGKWMRETSLDELGEVINIINGTMSVIGPRPQLVRDLVFMTKEQRIRHTAKPGLSGLAQVNGRNSICWEEKFNWDLKYIKQVNFKTDTKIIIKSIRKALIEREGITQGGMVTAEDLGDYLLGCGKISRDEYEQKHKLAKKLMDSVHLKEIN